MTTLSGPTRAFDLDDVDLFDLVGSVRLDRLQLVALLARAHDPSRSSTPTFPISGLTFGTTPALEMRRPVHLLADLLTMVEEARRPLDRISVCYVGDGEADIARSFLLAGTLLGMDIRIASPAAMWPSDELITLAQDLSVESGARLLITPDAGRAVLGARFVVVGAWAHGNLEPAPGQAPPAYLVTEDFLASSGLPATGALMEAGVVEIAPVVPRTLQSVQTTNRRRIMSALLSDWMAR